MSYFYSTMAMDDFRETMEIYRYNGNENKACCSMLKQAEGCLSKSLCSIAEDDLIRGAHLLNRHRVGLIYAKATHWCLHAFFKQPALSRTT